MQLYFAYGSNLSEAQMVKRCPSAKATEAARLMGYELFFAGHSKNWKGGVASIRPQTQGEVFGLLYAIEPADLDRLDRFEGTYRRQKISVLAGGEQRETWIYVRREDYPTTPPSPEYLAIMAHAYGRLGHPLEALLRAIVF